MKIYHYFVKLQYEKQYVIFLKQNIGSFSSTNIWITLWRYPKIFNNKKNSSVSANFIFLVRDSIFKCVLIFMNSEHTLI